MFEFINYISNIHKSVVVYTVHTQFFSLLFIPFALYLLCSFHSFAVFATLIYVNSLMHLTVACSSYLFSFNWMIERTTIPMNFVIMTVAELI